jgi:hypothetical protein
MMSRLRIGSGDHEMVGPREQRVEVDQLHAGDRARSRRAAVRDHVHAERERALRGSLRDPAEA